ncbi:MAG: 4-carboxy-4-hydroxy-2-oxoadipate aldolase/oxaloacetate decarboxylase [Paracoccaceae bacterium]|uniref:4-carboxy-4-hydroxy-2-oxoadipate aldolase/oxaloacetate decarboxylase n=1 Tax=Seohaeicola saemankumensis TaxID=481181 RepID=UPI001E2E315A|nr:4-carboxy-4-hydroxy-2-oxoadipate aldolase/oxaloacetate decarboxylase [Seohaeicola saemankumensis]MCD1627269.1 4-carboxy-4-hydroxy-2-oxoadipate aldolase/oxaloacetate decarboxylase [Seohaeicola saemankumensis]
MIGTAVKRIERADADTIAGLAKAGVATVHEAQGRTGAMVPDMRAIVEGAAIGGSAITALCAPGDNWMLHVAIELMQPGDVLVVATTSESRDGFFGDILAEYVRQRGGAGVILDTGIRDVRVLRDEGFPVWARAISAQGTVKETIGAVNVPVICGGQRIVPGDVVCGDDDGVVVVPRASAVQVLAAAQARVEKEDKMRADLLNGGKTLDLLGLREKAAAKGLKYVEGPVNWSAGLDQ